MTRRDLIQIAIGFVIIESFLFFAVWCGTAHGGEPNILEGETYQWICPKHGVIREDFESGGHTMMISTVAFISFQSDQSEVVRCPKCYYDALKNQCEILKKVKKAK